MSLAKSLDIKASASWIGHPYFDVIDNSSDFENKICRMIAVSIIRLFAALENSNSCFFF